MHSQREVKKATVTLARDPGAIAARRGCEASKSEIPVVKREVKRAMPSSETSLWQTHMRRRRSRSLW